MLTKIKKLNNRIKKHNLRLIKSWIQIIYYTKIIKKFSVDEFFLYDLTNKTLKEKRKYNSIQKNKKLKYKYNSKSSINKIDNKGNFFQYYGDFIKRKQYVFSNNNDDFINTFDNQRKLFVKPTNECKGRGAHIIDLKTFNIEAEKQNYRNHIFEEIIIQNKAVEQINPSSVNTVRLVTIVDQNKEVHILGGVLRVGRDGNIVDNSGAGGLFSHINIDDGAIDTNFFDNNGKTFEKHPDTKFKIKGFKIPNFDLICESVIEIAKIDLNARYVGWDIAITEDGFELIEGNTQPDSSFLQIANRKGNYDTIVSLLQNNQKNTNR